MSMLLHRKGDNPQALSLARGGIETGEDCGDTEAYVGCLLNTGMCLWGAGQAQEALPYYERGLAVARQRGDRHCIMWATGNLGVCLWSLGKIDEAQVHLNLALQGAREEGDVYNTVVNLANLASMVTVDPAQADSAVALLEEAMQLCRQQGMISVENYVELHLGVTFVRTGQTDKARKHLNAALVRTRQSGQLHAEWSIETQLARMDIQLKEWPAALRRLERVASAAHARSMFEEVAIAASAFGDILAAQGDLNAARDIWGWALGTHALAESRRKALSDKLAALPAPAAGDREAGSLKTIEDILARLRAMARG
jgi:tetratricopeptide (TPR) repeat protein